EQARASQSMLRAAPSSPREQSADIGQKLVSANRAIAVLLYQSIHNVVDAAQLIGVRRLAGGCDLHNILQVGEYLLLDRFFQAFVRSVFELLAFARVTRNANQDLLPESVLGIFRDSNLLFDRAHQLLIRFVFFFGDWIAHAFLVAIGLDVVEVV